MEIEKFINLREHVYHLTNPANLDSIMEFKKIKSTRALADYVDLSEKDFFLRTRRFGHKQIGNEIYQFSIRDQDPLNQNIAEKNLEDDFTFEDLVFLLNSRVFFWAKWVDLITHYSRYEKQNEKPIVLRLKTAELFSLNTPPGFCRLNSGAPRCNHTYDKGAPPRGKSLFLPSIIYDRTPSTVREVTFDYECNLPETFEITKHPSTPFKKIILNT